MTFWDILKYLWMWNSSLRRYIFYRVIDIIRHWMLSWRKKTFGNWNALKILMLMMQVSRPNFCLWFLLIWLRCRMAPTAQLQIQRSSSSLKVNKVISIQFQKITWMNILLQIFSMNARVTTDSAKKHSRKWSTKNSINPTKMKAIFSMIYLTQILQFSHYFKSKKINSNIN